MERKQTRTRKYQSLRSGKKIVETRSSRRENVSKPKDSKIAVTRTQKYSKYRKKINKGKMPLKKKLMIVGLVFSCLIAIGIFVWLILNPSIYTAPTNNDNKDVINGSDQSINNGTNKTYTFYDELKETWFINSLYNDDYIGQILFESELINEPFVQTVDNKTYSTKDFRTLEDSDLGTVFMDWNSNLKSQNITLYGKNTLNAYISGTEYVNEQEMFTPLKKLTNIANYEDNKYVYIALENEVRKYQIVSVYYCDLLDENSTLNQSGDVLYNLSYFDADTFISYKNKIKEIEFYDTGVDFTIDDNFLTLQTCVDEDAKISEIVLCKLIDTTTYEGDEVNNISEVDIVEEDATLNDEETINKEEMVDEEGDSEIEQ